MMFNILCIINTIVSLGIIIIDCWISANDKSQLKVVGVYLSISILSFMFGGCLLIVNSVKKDIHIYASMIGFVISFIMILLYISSFLTLNYSFTLFNYLNIFPKTYLKACIINFLFGFFNRKCNIFRFNWCFFQNNYIKSIPPSLFCNVHWCVSIIVR